MNIFPSLTVYGGKWQVVSSRAFDQEEIDAVSRAEVVASEFGNSVCFFLRGGGQTYIPLSNTSTLTPGDTVDMSSAQILTLHRDGQGEINRIQA